MSKKLQQKKHGLPGLSLASGRDGASYESGTNIYFGFINDYFETITVPVINLVCVAKKENGDYYTGIFYDNGNDQQNYTTSSELSENIYKPITDFDLNTRYPESYSNNQDSSIYIKVDVATGSPKDGYWNTDDDSLWKEEDSLSYEDAGYSTYSVQTMEKNPSYRIKPNIGSTNGGRYFYITENGTNYIFSTLNDKDSQKYREFTESEGRLNKAPSIAELIENDNNPESTKSLVNFVKYDKYGQQNIQFTDKLKSNIKSGDVIYFYTDKEKFDIDHQIEYMVVITDQLLNATVNDLIAHAIEKPLKYKFTDIEQVKDSEYVISNNDTVSVYYDNQLVEEYLKKFGNGLSNFVIRRS